MNNDQVVTDWLIWLQASGSSPGTLRVKRRYVLDLAKTADLLTITASQVQVWVGRPEWAPETRKSARASIRSFFAWATREGVCSDDPAANLPPVRVPVGKPKPAPESNVADAIDVELIAARLVETGFGRFAGELSWPRTPQAVRLMVLLGAYGGLRRSEIAHLRHSDVTPFGMRVKGKGGRLRVIPIHELIDLELQLLPEPINPDEWIFPSPVTPGEPIGEDFVSKWCKIALGGVYTAHTLRHRFGTRVYAGCKDIRAVQELLGHTKPETTARYVLIGHDVLTAAVSAVA